MLKMNNLFYEFRHLLLSFGMIFLLFIIVKSVYRIDNIEKLIPKINKNQSELTSKIDNNQNSFSLDFCEEQYIIIVDKNGLDIRFIPENLRTYEVCRRAVTNHWLAYAFVPEQHRTKELCDIVNSYFAKYYSNFNEVFDTVIPENFKTEMFYESAKEYYRKYV